MAWSAAERHGKSARNLSSSPLDGCHGAQLVARAEIYERVVVNLPANFFVVNF